MRVLAITKIFPNGKEPLAAAFNRQQFVELAKLCDLTVLEAIPSFPLAKLTGQPSRAAKLSALPDREVIAGIETVYMRQLYVPKVGLPIALPLYLASLLPYRELARGFDVIFGTWLYPDGVAAMLFAHALGKPCAIKVHGTDVNVVAKTQPARALLKRLLPRADATVSVARPLSEELFALGARPERTHLVANGVDTKVFFPRDRAACRRELGVPEGRPLVTFVGRLEPQKGLGELLEAFDHVKREVPGAMLALVGDGVSRAKAFAKKSEWGDALFLPGARPLAEVATWVGASDVFTLPSWREGTPNVVLEALASGRPVVGSRVGGIPDVLENPKSGLLVPAKDARALGDALVSALSRAWDADEVSACGPGSWAQSAKTLHGVLEGLAARPS